MVKCCQYVKAKQFSNLLLDSQAGLTASSVLILITSIMIKTVAARQQTSSWGFIFLNYHSSAAQKLHYYLVDQGLTLQALTSDSTLVRREKLLESANPRGIEIIDTASAWQSELKLSSHEAVRVCDAYDSDMLEKAIDYARLRLITWLVHRENFGQGISELQYYHCK